jgi:Subtilase family
LIRAACLAFLAVLAAGAAEAQVRDRAGRIDRVDRAAADRAVQRAIDRRLAAQQRVANDPVVTRNNPLLADRRLTLARDGFAARRSEILALNISPAARAAALAAGMTVLGETRAGPADAFTFTRLAAPDRSDPGAMLDLLRAADPQGVFDFNHAFAASAPQVARAPSIAAPATPSSSSPASPRTTIGMIDGGVLAAHPDLARAAIRQRAFPASSGLTPTDHGTAVAGRLAEAIDRPFSLVVADVLSETGADWTGADAVGAALAWLGSENIGAVNISLAGPPNAIVERITAYFQSEGGVIVAAVGNGGPFSTLIYPAAYPGVIGVTATDREGRIWPLATTGPQVDRVAVGVDVFIATLAGHTLSSGTSWAAPTVTAEVALAREHTAMLAGAR